MFKEYLVTEKLDDYLDALLQKGNLIVFQESAAKIVQAKQSYSLITAHIITFLKQLADPKTLNGFDRFAISSKTALGISMPNLRAFAKKIGTYHPLAQELWKSGIREAQMVACFIADPKQVTEQEMDQWVQDFDSWDVCDTCCQGLWSYTPHAVKKIHEWSTDDREFVKRAAFALMATLAMGKKNVSDETLIGLLPLITREAHDERNFVKKAVNWALRQIGKKNQTLNAHAVTTAQEIARLDSKAARWIASDALRELTSDAVITRLRVQAFRDLAKICQAKVKELGLTPEDFGGPFAD